MEKKKVKITTVVVTYNAYKGSFMPTCLDRLLAMQLENEQFLIDHSIIVVDSHSPDHTADKVKQNYADKVRLIASDQNLGYAGGNNVGFEIAIGQDSPNYLAVVTQDVYVQPDWLLQALKVAENDATIGIVQPLILLSHKPGLINTTGNITHFLGYGYAGNYLKPLDQYHNSEVKDVIYSSGAAFLMNANAYKEVGGFDEEMWMYNEDQDLSWRMWLYGYRSALAPKSRVYHLYEFSRSIQKMYWMDRNRLMNVFLNYHWATIFLILPVLLLNELAGLGFSLVGGWYKQKLQTWMYYLSARSWKLIYIKRRKRQKERKMAERIIIKNFTGRINFQDVENPVVTYIGNPLLSLYWFIIKSIIFW